MYYHFLITTYEQQFATFIIFLNQITDSAIRALDDKITLEYCDKKFKKMFKTTEIFSTFIPNSDESNKNSRKEESKMTLNVDHLNDHSNKTSFQLQEFTKYKEKRNELLGQVNNNLIGSTRV